MIDLYRLLPKIANQQQVYICIVILLRNTEKEFMKLFLSQFYFMVSELRSLLEILEVLPPRSDAASPASLTETKNQAQRRFTTQPHQARTAVLH